MDGTTKEPLNPNTTEVGEAASSEQIQDTSTASSKIVPTIAEDSHVGNGDKSGAPSEPAPGIVTSFGVPEAPAPTTELSPSPAPDTGVAQAPAETPAVSPEPKIETETGTAPVPDAFKRDADPAVVPQAEQQTGAERVAGIVNDVHPQDGSEGQPGAVFSNPDGVQAQTYGLDPRSAGAINQGEALHSAVPVSGNETVGGGIMGFFKKLNPFKGHAQTKIDSGLVNEAKIPPDPLASMGGTSEPQATVPVQPPQS